MIGPLARLAVDLERPTPGLVNRVPNPSGAGGTVAGWITPVAGTAMAALSDANGPYLRYTATSGTGNYFYSTPWTVTPGQFTGARWKVTGAGWYAQRIEFLASDKTTVVGSTLATWGRQSVSWTQWSISGPQPIPAGAAYARIRFDHMGSANGATALASGSQLLLRDVQVVTAATAAAIGSRRVNLILNGGAEDSTWSALAGSNLVDYAGIRVNTAPRFESWHWRGTSSGGAMYFYATGNTTIPPVGTGQPVPAGGKVTVAVSARPVTTARQFQFEIDLQTGGTMTSPLFTETAGQYVDVQHTFTVAAATNLKMIRIVYPAAQPYGEQHYLDGWQTLIGETTAGVIFNHLTPNTSTETYELAVLPSGGDQFGAVEHKFTATVEASPTYWQDITGPHGEIKIVRRPLDAGTLTGVLKPDQLAAGLDAEIMGGAGYRVRLGTQPLITASVTDRAPKDSRSIVPPVMVSAADAGRVLVGTPKTLGVDTLAALAAVLEDVGVPWSINGSSAQTGALNAHSNPNAKAIDQIAMARDRFLPAFAWVSRAGVIVINANANMDNTVKATITESDYSYFEQGYDVDSVINIVTVKVVATASGATTTTTYGPFKNQVSIDKWGEHPCTLTLLGVTSTVAQTVAQALLTANGDPAYQVLAVTVPIKRDDQDPIALLDLYDTARVQNTATGTNQLLRVSEVVHEITPDKWLAKFRFVLPALAAIPQVIPEP